MPKKRKMHTAARASRAAFIALALVAIGIAGVFLTSFLKSPRGNLLLLDAGFADRYEVVQDGIDAELGEALRDLGVDKSLRETTTPLSVRNRVFHEREWSVDLPRSGSLVRANLALTEAVRRAGGVVRSSKEDPSGTVTMRVGSRRYTTHVVRIRAAGAPEARGVPGETDGEKLPSSAVPGGRPRVALVIDDFGYSGDGSVEKFLTLDMPLTVSVIPELPFSKYAVARAVEGRKQAMLHLPMEAESIASEVPPVRTSMSDEEIATLVEKYLRDTEGVIGVNNHLGSVATQDARVMEAVVTVLKRRRLFFLDSLTTNKSVAYNTAKTLGVRAARNDLFLDADTEDPEIIESRLARLLEIARTRGYAIGIGHPKPWTYGPVEAFEDRAREAGVDLVFLSELVE